MLSALICFSFVGSTALMVPCLAQFLSDLRERNGTITVLLTNWEKSVI